MAQSCSDYVDQIGQCLYEVGAISAEERDDDDLDDNIDMQIHLSVTAINRLVAISEAARAYQAAITAAQSSAVAIERTPAVVAAGERLADALAQIRQG